MKQFVGHYLKGAPETEWTKKGLPRVKKWEAVAVLGVFAASVLAAQQTDQAQTPQVVFRSSADLVRVGVVAVDKQGNAVKGLTVADFTLFDRKKPQPIVAFTEESHDPGARPSGPTAPVFPPTLKMDVATNQLPRR
jgi:hypothetical protein